MHIHSSPRRWNGEKKVTAWSIKQILEKEKERTTIKLRNTIGWKKIIISKKDKLKYDWKSCRYLRPFTLWEKKLIENIKPGNSLNLIWYKVEELKSYEKKIFIPNIFLTMYLKNELMPARVCTSLRKKLSLIYGRLYSFKQPLIECHYCIVIAKPKKP